jgi:N-acetylglucosaminyldiphosphoundecaprenol N-acetyl-beta-D-mannosaminyltransferase
MGEYRRKQVLVQPMSKIVTHKYLGLNFSIFRDKDLFEEIDSKIKKNEKTIIFGYSLSILPKFKTLPEMFKYSNRFDIFLTDGRGIYLLLKLLGYNLGSDLSIPRFVFSLLTFANEKNYSVLLLGATKKLNSNAVGYIKAKYPGIPKCDGIDGYFNENDESKIIEQINLIKPDILLIGISSPKKERIADKWKDKLDTSIIVPCGGVLDVLAGDKKVTPKPIKKIGLAWLYRFLQEPVRLFKPVLLNVLNIIFILIPIILYKTKIQKDKNFSIPEFYISKNIAK